MIDVLDCIIVHCVDDKTRVTILDHSGVPIASGIGFQDQILDYYKKEVIEMHYDGPLNELWIRIRGDKLW